MGQLGDSYSALQGWRGELNAAVSRYGHWLEGLDVEHSSLIERLAKVHDRLKREKLTIAFVAEFSRGKSELINAIFFGEHGRRVLPSSAGRTTMCPTELYYDADEPLGLRLLPIETRLRDVSMADLRNEPSEWRQVSIASNTGDELANMFQMVKETKKISVGEAILLGFDPSDDNAGLRPDNNGNVEVPRWRHVLVNVQHPLLEKGLVIIDTPGLNAIGLEPELTLSMIPNADAVLFVLAADTGVTKTDIDVWRDCISSNHRSGRMVVLNKIDGLWDDIRDDVQIELEIAQQISSVSQILELPAGKVYPVSAQKALAAKLSGDLPLLRKSRLLDLEAALADELVPQKHLLVREAVQHEFDGVHATIEGDLSSRRRQLVEQLFELSSLRGKNSTVVDHMASRVARERDDFESSVKHLHALRAVFNRQSELVYNSLSLESLKRHVRDAREHMKSSRLSTGIKEGMTVLLTDSRKDFEAVSKAVEEVTTLMSAMYKTFNAQHGLNLGAPMSFSMLRFSQELDRIDSLQKQQFGAMALATTERWALMRKFFETVASRLKDLYDRARKDVEVWLRAILAPIEGQVREHQAQLKRRVESLKRIREAEDTLEVKIFELEENRASVEQQIALCSELSQQVLRVLSMPMPSSSKNLVTSAQALAVGEPA
jgi:Dynamin family